MRGRFVLAAALCTAGALACSPPGDDGKVERISTAVGNGTTALPCAFPTVVNVGGCSGTLVHPRVVLTAAHCGSPRTISFGERGGQGTARVERCAKYPNYKVQATDWHYCVLAEPVDLPVTPILPRSCAESVLKTGGALTIVGFGSSNPGSFGTKRFGRVAIIDVLWGAADNKIRLGQPSTACPGDSGGPAFVRMTDGTWWHVGIASTLTGSCGGATSRNSYSLSPTAIAWMEKETGIDLTPCFDDAGKWQTGPDCKNVFAADEGKGSGSWTTSPWCQQTPAQSAPMTCEVDGRPPRDGGTIADAAGARGRDASPVGSGDAVRREAGAADARGTMDDAVPGADAGGPTSAGSDGRAVAVGDGGGLVPSDADLGTSVTGPAGAGGTGGQGGGGMPAREPAGAGCGCRVGGARSQSSVVWLLVAIAGLALRRGHAPRSSRPATSH